MKKLILLCFLLTSGLVYSNTVDVNCSTADGSINYTGDSHGFSFHITNPYGEITEYSRKDVKYTPLSEIDILSKEEEDRNCYDGIATYSIVTKYVEEGKIKKRDGTNFIKINNKASISFFLICKKVERLLGPCE